VDDLQTIATDYLDQRKDEIAKCEAIIWDKARPLLERGEVGRSAWAVEKTPSVS
jgi:glutamyl-tRNA reductase